MSVTLYFYSRLKQYFWPPVPNLDKVLQGFLTEINGQKWVNYLTTNLDYWWYIYIFPRCKIRLQPHACNINIDLDLIGYKILESCSDSVLAHSKFYFVLTLQDHSVVAKQCFEETTSSVVEIMSEDNVSGLEKQSQESTQLLSPEGTFSSTEKVDWSPVTEIFPDYVTLNKDSIIICPKVKGNKYVYEQVGEKEDPVVGEALLQTCHCSCSSVTPCLCTEYLNRSYLPLAEVAERFSCKVSAASGPGNLYANFPCS